MPFENWGDTRLALARGLADLEDREFLILGETPAVSGPPPLRSFRESLHPAPTRFVQVLRLGDILSAECVGAVSLGGTWEMDTDLIEWLRALGWLTPAQSEATYGKATPNFDQYVERSDLSLLASVLVASLQVLGALPHDLELQTQSGWAAEGIG